MADINDVENSVEELEKRAALKKRRNAAEAELGYQNSGNAMMRAQTTARNNAEAEFFADARNRYAASRNQAALNDPGRFNMLERQAAQQWQQRNDSLQARKEDIAKELSLGEMRRDAMVNQGAGVQEMKNRGEASQFERQYGSGEHGRLEWSLEQSAIRQAEIDKAKNAGSVAAEFGFKGQQAQAEANKQIASTQADAQKYQADKTIEAESVKGRYGVEAAREQANAAADRLERTLGSRQTLQDQRLAAKGLSTGDVYAVNEIARKNGISTEEAVEIYQKSRMNAGKK